VTQYTHPNLSPLQKLKARWRSIWLVANQAVALTEQDHVPAREAFKLARRQHNEKVRARAEEHDA
jgi:hypothetical protein